MIRQALVALGPKSVATGVLVGSAVLALGAVFLPRAVASAPASGMYRLVLHAPEQRGAFYVSAWAEGEVFVADSSAKSMTFVRRGDEHDGCTWQGTERLSRMSPGVYAYDYSEQILACRPDARPFVKTPRTGIVTAEKWDGPATATAMTGIQAPGDLWNPSDIDDEEHCQADEADEDDIEDTEQAIADAQREIAEAQQQIADAVAQANEEVKAALAADDD
jgi:hypothetical protein